MIETFIEPQLYWDMTFKDGAARPGEWIWFLSDQEHLASQGQSLRGAKGQKLALI